MSLLCSNPLTASRFTQGKIQRLALAFQVPLAPLHISELISKNSALHPLGSSYTNFLAVTQTCQKSLTSGFCSLLTHLCNSPRHFFQVSAQMPLPQRDLSRPSYLRKLPPLLVPLTWFLVAPVIDTHFTSCVSLTTRMQGIGLFGSSQTTCGT